MRVHFKPFFFGGGVYKILKEQFLSQACTKVQVLLPTPSLNYFPSPESGIAQLTSHQIRVITFEQQCFVKGGYSSSLRVRGVEQLYLFEKFFDFLDFSNFFQLFLAENCKLKSNEFLTFIKCYRALN